MEPDGNSQYQSYYGYDKPGRSKLTIRRGRTRAASNPETVDSDDDELQSRRIRTQMSQLNKSLAEVDAKKRDEDRRQLLAAAERKVHAQMLGLDKKIFDETGKMSPAMVDEWDAKARARAAANSEARMEHHGKVHLGNGRYMDQADIDAVAQARVQPTLDDITQKTEKRRAEEEELRLELEEKRRQAQVEKERAAETKAEERRVRAQEKAAARQEKEAEREKAAEEKRLAKEDKRKSREAAKATTAADATLAATDGAATNEKDNDDLYRDPTPVAASAGNEDPFTDHPSNPASPTSPKSESKGLKSFLSKLKRRSKTPQTATEPGFLGGIALHHSRSASHSQHGSAPPSPAPEPDQAHASERRYSDVSSLSSMSNHRMVPERTVTGETEISEYEEARDGFDEKLAPPPSFTVEESGGRMRSPTRDSKFREVGI